MSILEKTQVDGIGKSKIENKVALMIADHLDWSDEQQHLVLLQDKINSYISFIESGQVYDAFPESKEVDGFIFELHIKYDLTKKCEQFLDVVRNAVKDLNIEVVISR